ncbi:sensor histidine kinase [Streptomyces sp. 7N604]|uniref:sensor histidine kinase n=1 Tax=Streptomyces sp. 7N604 TaxID=3457415 RepID=UPI003FD14DF8
MPRPAEFGLAFTAATALCVLGVLGQFPGRVLLRRLTLRHADSADSPSFHSYERLVAAREEERTRLRVDLHDSLGPALAGIRLRLDVAAERVVQPGTRRLILDAAAEMARTVDDIRHIIDDLRPPDLEGVGLRGALRHLVHRADAGTSLILFADLPESDHVPAVSFATELAAYRIASEGLTNVLRHAKARSATVRLTDRDGWLVLEVIDDGVGLPTAGAMSRGVGLSSMTRRAEEVGGHCEVLPRPDGRTGTLVRATLPRCGT